jgi:hypothetical protein
MQTHEASRTLVKSPPELWAECSDAAALARHLDGFGEIRITRLDPETAVAWEGEKVRGTVRIEPAGWGTKVILTAEEAVAEEVQTPAPEPVAATEPVEPVAATEPVEVVEAVEEPLEPAPETPAARRRRFARLRAFFRGTEPVEVVPEPVPDESPPEIEASEPEPEPEPGPPPPAASDGAEAALSAALDSLGQAHHRPYSRA